MSSLAQFFGAKRFIFNHYLHQNKTRFACNQKHLSNFDINNDITQLKKLQETSWLKHIDDWCLKHASEDVSTAYQNFFNTIKGKSKLKSMIEYKSSWNYRTFHQIDRFYPSSKLCSCCGHKKESLLLSERVWICQNCNKEHDRDINAAINILHKGQKDLYDQVLPSHTTGEVGSFIPNDSMKYSIKNDSSSVSLEV